jgi:hypothetical protein
MFRGPGGVPSDGALALRLETGDATAPLVLAAPAAPGGGVTAPARAL